MKNSGSQNFSIARQDRAGGRGGGTCIYFRSTLPAKPHPDVTTDDVECAWIVLKGARAPHLLGCVYRPPSETVAFWARLQTVLQAATNNTGSVTMMGDFNVNADLVSPGSRIAKPYSRASFICNRGKQSSHDAVFSDLQEWPSFQNLWRTLPGYRRLRGRSRAIKGCFRLRRDTFYPNMILVWRWAAWSAVTRLMFVGRRHIHLNSWIIGLERTGW